MDAAARALGPSSSFTRSYLPFAQRHEALLDAASDIIDEVGIYALTMAEVAHRSQVSRQLVYQHFDTLGKLLQEIISRRFNHLQQAFLAETESSGDSRSTARSQLYRVVSLPPSEQRFLAEFFTSHGGPDEFRRAVATIRELLIDRWATIVSAEGLTVPQVRARIWATFYAVMGLWEQMAEGVICLDDAFVIIEKHLVP